MGYISVRGVDDELAARLKTEAKKSKLSVNRYVLLLLKKATGGDKAQKYTQTYSDLDHLFGTWSKEEYDAIQGKIDSECVIDEELWR